MFDERLHETDWQETNLRHDCHVKNRAKQRAAENRVRNSRGHFIAAPSLVPELGEIWPLTSEIGRELGIYAVTGERQERPQHFPSIYAPKTDGAISLPYVGILHGAKPA